MTNAKWADLIREHYGEIVDEIANQLWDGFGSVQHDVLVYEDGTVDTVPNIGGNDYHTNAYTVWTSRGLEYATPYDYWSESEWVSAVREIVGNENMSEFWERIIKDQNADDIDDYLYYVDKYYDPVSHILTHNTAFENIMHEIDENWKQDTEHDRRESAESIIDLVLEELSE